MIAFTMVFDNLEFANRLLTTANVQSSSQQVGGWRKAAMATQINQLLLRFAKSVLR